MRGLEAVALYVCTQEAAAWCAGQGEGSWGLGRESRRSTEEREPSAPAAA